MPARTKASSIDDDKPPKTGIAPKKQKTMWTGPSWRLIVAQQRGSSADKRWVRCSAGPGSVDSPNNIINNNNSVTIHSAASIAQTGSANDNSDDLATADAVTASAKSGKAANEGSL